MIFDKLCQVVERHYPEYKYLAENARLFHFKGKPHEFLPKKVDGYDYMANFFLPFPVIAIEDDASCVLLADIKKDQTGLGDWRMFLECIPNELGNEYFGNTRPENMMPDEVRSGLMPPDSCTFSAGLVKYTEIIQHDSKSQKNIEGIIQRISCVSKDENFFDLTAEQLKDLEWKYQAMIREGLKNPTAAIEEIMMLNTPDRFIVENKPKKAPKANKKKIPRSHQRSQYTLMTVPDIRTLFHEKSSKRLDFEITGHERRKHFRTFRSDKFVKMKGKSIIIPATWVGPREAESSNRTYKVRVDL